MARYTNLDGTTPDKGLIFFTIHQKRLEQVPVKEKINVDGKVIEVVTLITREVYVPVEAHVEITKGRVISPDGKQLPNDQVWKRLKAGSVIVLSMEGITPAEPYLRALNKDTLIVIPGPSTEQID